MQNYKITPRQIENATVEVEALLGLAKNKEHFSTVIANDFVADEAKKESEHWYQKVAEVEGAISAARRGEVPYLQAKTIFEVAAGVTSLLDWEYKDNSPLPELEVGAYSALTDTQLMQYFLQMCKHKNDIDDESYTAMKDRKLVLKGDTLASLREKLEYYKANPKFEDVKMKKYALVIDTSGANKGGSQILVQDFDTLLQARAKLATLNLSFGYGEGKVYCATIAERAEGTLNRYFQIQRTDDGKKWNEDVSERPYIPVDWEKIENWLDIEKFQNATKSVNWKEQIGESFSLNGNPDGLKYTVVSVNDDDSVNIVREDSWTFRAVRPETLGNGKIEWAYSTDGYFASEEILSQYISAKNTEKSSESEEFVMQNDVIKARVTPIENGTNLKGSATVTIGDQFAIHGVKIVEGKDGLFVSMPSEKDKNGEFQSTVFPTSRESAQHLKSIVLGAYQDALQNGKQEKNELSPMQMNVKVSNLRENTYGNNVKASCQITVNGAFVVKGVKVVEKSDGTLFAAMPSKQDQYGEYIAVANPITKEFNEKSNRL
jgi:stage V sporulation protein G